jgi:hypothetical protein
LVLLVVLLLLLVVNPAGQSVQHSSFSLPSPLAVHAIQFLSTFLDAHALREL